MLPVELREIRGPHPAHGLPIPGTGRPIRMTAREDGPVEFAIGPRPRLGEFPELAFDQLPSDSFEVGRVKPWSQDGVGQDSHQHVGRVDRTPDRDLRGLGIALCVEGASRPVEVAGEFNSVAGARPTREEMGGHSGRPFRAGAVVRPTPGPM